MNCFPKYKQFLEPRFINAVSHNKAHKAHKEFSLCFMCLFGGLVFGHFEAGDEGFGIVSEAHAVDAVG